MRSWVLPRQGSVYPLRNMLPGLFLTRRPGEMREMPQRTVSAESSGASFEETWHARFGPTVRIPESAGLDSNQWWPESSGYNAVLDHDCCVCRHQTAPTVLPVRGIGAPSCLEPLTLMVDIMAMAGYFQANEGQLSCVNCDDVGNFFQESVGTTVCDPCPENTQRYVGKGSGSNRTSCLCKEGRPG
jgi:hypothetical protein